MQPPSLQMIRRHQMLGPPLERVCDTNPTKNNIVSTVRMEVQKMLQPQPRTKGGTSTSVRNLIKQGPKAQDNEIVTNSLPRSSTKISPERSTRQWTCLCSVILVSTVNFKNACIHPYNRNCENHRKLVRHRLCGKDNMR